MRETDDERTTEMASYRSGGRANSSGMERWKGEGETERKQTALEEAWNED